MRSSEYSHIKAINGWSGDWFFAFTNKQYVVEWNAYDPEANNWHHLPSIPTAEPHGHHHGFSCVCVCNKFFVMGGFHETFQGPLFPENKSCETTDVWMFDPFKKQWSRRASMKMPRSWFSCVVMSGKVYVAGGFNCSKRGGVTNAEVYDPVEDRSVSK
ncbi:hypothetical protein QJS04_geneDACA015756 [Acorus gramineus]|uniref:Uncharacterized protein n=1 Tax=Acorus gramineus TaxID=55184 RepID=A0AAV9BKH7_ACOGR|nr:hypothetical protein QJS04_geneDACA015756 [Acorus gramineus]